jgi:hypothetical protein
MKLEAKLEQIPPDIKASLGISTSHAASIFSSMGESVTSPNFRNSGKDVSSSQGMTAIRQEIRPFLFLTRLRDFDTYVKSPVFCLCPQRVRVECSADETEGLRKG